MKDIGCHDGAIGPGGSPRPTSASPGSRTIIRSRPEEKCALEGFIGNITTNTTGFFSFSNAQTGLPSTNGQNLSGGTVGLHYASFLLGSVNTAQHHRTPELPTGKTAVGILLAGHLESDAQTDAGLRPALRLLDDFKEQYGRLPIFSAGRAESLRRADGWER